MDTKSVIAAVDELEDNLDDLEESLQPLLENALSATTRKLPLLERAKLNVLLVYAVESLIFCL
jgi:exosome complex protein LRP1